jgi:hypothetical protein
MKMYTRSVRVLSEKKKYQRGKHIIFLDSDRSTSNSRSEDFAMDRVGPDDFNDGTFVGRPASLD